MRIVVNNAGPQSEIFVDVFDADPRTQVTCKLDGDLSSLIELTRNGVTDPYVVEEFARYRHMCKPWVAAAPSSHIWSAALPYKLGPDGEVLVMRVTRENARPLTRHVTV
jgi:hypothetical protein